MAELQRAVALAERRALESVAGERLKMERLIMESTRNVMNAATATNSSNSDGDNNGQRASLALGNKENDKKDVRRTTCVYIFGTVY